MREKSDDDDDSFDNEDFNDFSKMSISSSKPSSRSLAKENSKSKSSLEKPFQMVSLSQAIKIIENFEKKVAENFGLDQETAEEVLKLAKYDQKEITNVIKMLKNESALMKQKENVIICEICYENEILKSFFLIFRPFFQFFV